jgi:demethylmenaquinone methyltransferase/2-methoxy-6-polyprenyl-1,4-benzoquinol methylase
MNVADLIQTPEGKRQYNEIHFTEAAPKYDFVTRVLSLGQDSQWKKKLIQSLPQQSCPVCVDLACGTGDLTLALAEKYPTGEILGVDLTESMLDIACVRNTFSAVKFVRQDLGNLGITDSSVDIITASYALRNAPDLRQCLHEIFRVLRPGGVAAFLEFSKSSFQLHERMQNVILKLWGGFWGWLLHGNPEIHGYIAASLETFPDQMRVYTLFERCGFRILQKSYFLGRMVAVVIVEKP